MKICEAGRDPCGCNNWSKGIRTINGQYPDDDREFGIIAGDGIEVSPATAGIEIAVKTPLPGPMVYRGTVGTGGTVASLPDANIENIGWTYVALTAGSTPDDTPKTYQIGDMLISNGEEWTVIPAGDDPVDWSQIQNKPTTVAGYGITDALKNSGDQTLNGNLTEYNPIELSTITGSTPIRGINAAALLNGVVQNFGVIQFRRYSDRSRVQLNLTRYNDSPVGYVSMGINSYDNGRISVTIDNNVAGTTTSHIILDSNP